MSEDGRFRDLRSANKEIGRLRTIVADLCDSNVDLTTERDMAEARIRDLETENNRLRAISKPAECEWPECHDPAVRYVASRKKRACAAHFGAMNGGLRT